MRLALALGRRGLGRTAPNPAVGAVVVRDGVIVGRGWTQPGGRPHAEVEALRRAGDEARGATLYVTLEPCSHTGKTPPCADAVIAAGVARVVSAMEDPNPLVAGQGHARLRAAGIAVDVGICGEEAAHDHAGHICRVREQRPYVVLKLALSRDGMIGAPGGRPVKLTGPAADARVHMLRAECDAILIGIGAAAADDPQLTCRLPGMLERSPVRIVLDPSARLPLTSQLVTSARDIPLWVVTNTSADHHARRALADAGAEVIELPAVRDVPHVLAELSRRNITRLMVEGGARTAQAFVDADLVDELWLFDCEPAIGEGGVAPLDGLSLDALRESPNLRTHLNEMVGADRLTIFCRN